MNSITITQQVNQVVQNAVDFENYDVATALDNIRDSLITQENKVEFRDAIKNWFKKSISYELLDVLDVYLARFLQNYL